MKRGKNLKRKEIKKLIKNQQIIQQFQMTILMGNKNRKLGTNWIVILL